ncbi:alpha-L-fucosidase [Streptomyces rhizosphaericus]|uniref:alpha-L-fucosidase n=3 Tax=Streptomyces rhizosphaericus TaxID=114699 RepID=A0ABP4CKJ5_9ACTN
MARPLDGTPGTRGTRGTRGRRRALLALLDLALAALAAAAVPPAPAEAAAQAPGRAAARAGCEGPITPAPQQIVEDCDTPARIVDKAAHTVPTPGQRAWQQREITAFTHFGMNTMTGRQWGSGAEDEKLFDPPELAMDQWMRAYKAAGAKQVMLTAKHHDGFVLYPSRYTDHDVEASPWWTKGPGGRNPDGDVLGAYVKAARKAGLKVGVYLSPADGAELPHAWHAQWVEKIREKQQNGEELSLPERMALEDGDRAPAGQGRYGNGSKPTERTIPTLVPGDDRADKVASGALPSFRFAADDYDAYYLNQIYEILTQYGPVDEFWLDGANPWGGAGVTQHYNVRNWFELIHALSPNSVIFQGAQGVRWVGNEDGVARETEWSVTPSAVDPWTVIGGGLPNDSTDADIGSRAKLTAPGVRYLQWYPAEADVSIRPGWFHDPAERPKTPDQLMSLYERSVGRNASLLLNAGPAKNGRIDDADMASLTAFGKAVRTTYGTGSRPTTGHPVTFDRVRLGEDIRQGQRVEEFTVQARVAGTWRDIASGTTIGARRILPLAAPVTADGLRIRVLASRAAPRLLPPTVHLSEAGRR